MPHIEISESLIRLFSFLPLFIISITVHEFAHAIVASHYGDDTAKSMGRLTLNPLKHIDLFGTIVMPLLSFTSGFALIGWAKPIPVDRSKLHDPIKDDLLVSAAGPLSNLLLALVFLGGLIVLGLLNLHPGKLVGQIFVYSVYFNIFLCLFNLLPLPPLDGAHILFDLFPNEYTARYLRMGMVGSLILLVAINTPVFAYFMNIVNSVTLVFFKLYEAVHP